MHTGKEDLKKRIKQSITNSHTWAHRGYTPLAWQSCFLLPLMCNCRYLYISIFDYIYMCRKPAIMETYMVGEVVKESERVSSVTPLSAWLGRKKNLKVRTVREKFFHLKQTISSAHCHQVLCRRMRVKLYFKVKEGAI